MESNNFLNMTCYLCVILYSILVLKERLCFTKLQEYSISYPYDQYHNHLEFEKCHKQFMYANTNSPNLTVLTL